MIRFGLLGCGRIARRHSDLLGGNHIAGASLTAVFDFVYLVASATWVDSGDDMDGLIPRSDWFHRLLARWEAQVL